MQQKKSILWLASWYPTRLDPYPGDFIQRHAKALALYYPVHVLHIAKDEKAAISRSGKTETTEHGQLTETIHYYHPPQTGIRMLDRLISTRYFLKAGKKLVATFVKEHPTTLLHVHVAMRHGLLAVWAKKKFGIPFVITEHWTGYNQLEYPAHLRPAKWFWMATKRIFKEADFFYPEVNIVGKIVNETICPIPFKAVSNAVDTRLFYYDPEKPGADSFFQFVHVSTLSFQKNIEGILNTIERLGLEQNCHFTLVGPAETSIIERVKNSLVLKKLVTLTGPVTYERVAEEVRKAHCLLMFSRFENQPCVILEALCAGLPVLSTRVGGIAEVINEQNGILIEPGNEAELTEAIFRIRKEYDHFDTKEISEKARQLYSYEQIGRQMLDYYLHNKPGMVDK